MCIHFLHWIVDTGYSYEAPISPSLNSIICTFHLLPCVLDREYVELFAPMYYSVQYIAWTMLILIFFTLQ